jgi:tetratricopeptide (TPR) repeat protein
MANKTLRRTVILGSPGDNSEAREWPFVVHLRALGRQPDSARRAWEKTYKARGLAAAREGRLQEAIRLLEHARIETPWHDEEIDANLTELRTIRRLEKKLELRPYDAPTLLALGKAYFAQERGDAALDCFSRAARAAPTFAEAHAMIGLELHFRGQSAEGEAAYKEALRLQPGHQLAATYLRDLQRGDPPGGGVVDSATPRAERATQATHATHATHATQPAQTESPSSTTSATAHDEHVIAAG